MPIPESFYVDVNINYQQPTTLTGNIPMSVLISETATSTKTYNSLQQVASDYTLGTEPEYLAAQMYFNNGGTQLLIFQQGSGVSDTAVIEALLTAYENFVWVTFTADKTLIELQTISQALSASTQQLPKYLAQTSKLDVSTTSSLVTAGCTNIALLYSTENTVTPYSAIVIPAYFSSINVGVQNSIRSMIFTQVSGITVADVEASTLTNLYAANWNVVVNLGNKYTILDGGKMVDGQPIHSAWGFALFQQDCENVVSDLLLTKLPYTDSSNTVIENALSQVCNYYVTAGLIGTNKTYNQPTQTTTYNGTTYTLINQGSILNLGYLIYSIPVSNASASDISLGRIPPIYIYAVINDVVRLVTINGEVSK